jgi:hypothetical protein
MVVVPNTNVARRGIIIGFVVHLGCGSNRLYVMSLNRSSGLPTTNTRVVRTPCVVLH